MRTYVAQRGETRRWLIHAPSGTDLTGWSVSCHARAFDQRRRTIQPEAAVAAELGVSTFAGDSDRGPGWYLTLSSADCADLAPGVYLLDARMALPGGDVEITDPWLLAVHEAATGPVE